MAHRTIAGFKISKTAKDHTGERFGRLTVLRPVGRDRHYCITWACRCDCGTETHVQYTNLRTGHTQSCGCMWLETITKHGSARDSGPTKEYRIWNAMKNRCRNPQDKNFHLYGGRGITYCERWDDFQNFISDMGQCPPRMSLERTDNSKGYNPENCRWATQAEQCRNMRRNRVLTYHGKSLCLTDWAAEVGLTRDALDSRLRSGWTLERALTTPSHRTSLRSAV